MRRWLPYLLLSVLVLAVGVSDALKPLDDGLREARFELVPRPASGNVVLVEIDARSVRELGIWPWPRRLHGEALAALERAGASQVAFDVDFSSASAPAQDRAFEDALKAARIPVVLPRFPQHLSIPGAPGRIVDTAPLARFARHAWLGSVNVRADTDGVIRTMHSGAGADDDQSLSLADMLAGKTVRSHDRFLVDFSIRPETIPRISFVDLLRGNADPKTLAGRTAIIGGTAAELADRFAVPVYSVIPGPLLQALTLETVLQDRKLHSQSLLLTVIGLVVIALALPFMRGRANWRLCSAVIIAAALSIEAVAVGVQTAYPVSLATGTWHALLGSGLVFVLLGEIDFQSLLARLSETEARNREEIMRQVVDDSLDGIVIVGQDHRIFAINDAACAILRLPHRTAHAGRRLEDLLPPQLSDAIAHLADSDDADEEPAVLHELTHFATDGSHVDIEYVLTRSTLRTRDGSEEGTIAESRIVTCSFRDISERKRAELAIRRAAEEAMAANRAKTQFLANMGHELRTPLNAVIGFSEIIRDELYGPLGEPRYAESAAEIHSGGTRLLELLNRILDIVRLESNAFDFNADEIELAEVFVAVRAAVARWPQSAGRELRIDEPPKGLTIRADFRVVKEILLQLLSNAVKFTAPGGRISVALACDPATGLRMKVTDDGTGIPEQALAEVTRPFYQADGDHDRKSEGAGLGLALVKAYVRALDGSLEIRSAPGEGTRVIVSLPTAIVLHEGAPGGRTPPPDMQQTG